MSRGRPEIHNYEGVVDYGLVEDAFEWNQDNECVYVTIHDVKKGTRGRNIDYKLERNHLTVGIKGEPPFIQGELLHRVSLDDSSWGLDTDDMKLEITLVKHQPQPVEWWASLLVGGTEIDVDLIEGSKYLDRSLLKKVKAQKAAQKAAEAQGGATPTAPTAVADLGKQEADDLPPLEDDVSKNK